MRLSIDCRDCSSDGSDDEYLRMMPLVFPSVAMETFDLVCIQAMALGVAVVNFGIGGSRVCVNSFSFSLSPSLSLSVSHIFTHTHAHRYTHGRSEIV